MGCQSQHEEFRHLEGAEPLRFPIKVSHLRWSEHLIRMRSRRLPFLGTIPTERRPQADPEHAGGDYMSHMAWEMSSSPPGGAGEEERQGYDAQPAATKTKTLKRETCGGHSAEHQHLNI